MDVLYLLGLISPEGVSEQLHCSRGIHELAGGAHHEGKETPQLLHKSYIPLLLLKQTDISTLTLLHRHTEATILYLPRYSRKLSSNAFP